MEQHPDQHRHLGILMKIHAFIAACHAVFRFILVSSPHTMRFSISLRHTMRFSVSDRSITNIDQWLDQHFLFWINILDQHLDQHFGSTLVEQDVDPKC